MAIELSTARVGRLATVGTNGRPHCVPVCFIKRQGRFLIALDEKPKRVEVRQLRRVRNILENPHVTLTIDHYEENWSRLWFCMVEGLASLVVLREEELSQLREKYPQYGAMNLQEAIAIESVNIVRWSASPGVTGDC